jgi:hypothetical protein
MGLFYIRIGGLLPDNFASTGVIIQTGSFISYCISHGNSWQWYLRSTPNPLTPSMMTSEMHFDDNYGVGMGLDAGHPTSPCLQFA